MLENKSAEELLREKLLLSQGISSSDEKPNGLKDISDSEEKDPLKLRTSDNLTHTIQVFENIEFDIIVNNNGIELYPFKAILDAVDYKSNISVAASLVREKYKQQIPIFNQKANRYYETWYVTEPGMYQFLGRTNAPKAEKLQDWINEEVLPTIRKTGSYSLNPAPKSDIQLITESFTKCIEELTKFQKTADLKLNYLYEIHKSAEIKSENQFHLLTNLISQQMNISAQTNTTLAVNTYQTQVANKATFVSQTITHATVKDFLKNRNQKLNNVKYYPRLVSDTLSKILKQNPGRCNGKLVEMHSNVKAFPIELLTWYFESEPDSLINLI